MTNEDERWEQHRREHELIGKAVELALVTREKALSVALDDHHREHLVHESAHGREHTATEGALNKAEIATEKRFESVNEFREQLRTQAATLATRELVDQISKDTDRRFVEASKISAERFDTQGRAITVIEKGDVKQEGKALGQGTVVAIIVGAVGFVGTLLGIVIVLANVLTN